MDFAARRGFIGHSFDGPSLTFGFLCVHIQHFRIVRYGTHKGCSVALTAMKCDRIASVHRVVTFVVGVLFSFLWFGPSLLLLIFFCNALSRCLCQQKNRRRRRRRQRRARGHTKPATELVFHVNVRMCPPSRRSRPPFPPLPLEYIVVEHTPQLLGIQFA